MRTDIQYPESEELIIERPDLQEAKVRFAYSAITLVAWLVWIYLWLPAISFLAWIFGIRLFVEHVVLADRQYVATFLAYLAVVLAIAFVVMIWSAYNWAKYGGMDRRTPPGPVSDAQLQVAFELEAEQVQALQESDQVSVRFDEIGKIVGVRREARVTS